MTIGYAQTVTRCHYWIDKDRTHEKTISVSSTQIDWSMNVADVGEGMHTLYYRLQDSNGEWSITNSWQFFVKRIVTNTDIKVTDLEYWVDDSKAHFTTLTVTDGKASFILDASDLREGMHTLYFRFKDNEGQYSFANSWSFFVIRHVVNSDIKVTDLEYWVDDSKAHFTTMTVTDGKASFILDASDLREGMHTLYYRFKDNEGQYSFANSWSFFVIRHVVNSDIKVTDLEYWVDDSKAHFTTQTVTDGKASFVLDASDLREGMHTLFYRFKDNEKQYSFVHTWQFFVVRHMTNDAIQITDLEYWVDTDKAKYKSQTVNDNAAVFSLNLADMREGLHTLFYRFKDNESGWSYLRTWHFFKVRLMTQETLNVIQCEYWIDNAYDLKQVVTVTEPDVALAFDTEELMKGTHTLYYRFKDNEGEYGQLYVVTFERVNPYDPVMILPIDATELNDEMKRANPDYMAYPTEIEDQIERDVHIQCDPPKEGFGPFSVSATKQVKFSQGNLQYQASTNTWRFAEHQWDYIGNATNGTVYVNGVKCDNSNISSTYAGWIDLFGWGTGNNPTNISTNNNSYSSFTDWGMNTIINNESVNQWRTLTLDEWRYLFFSRNNHDNLCGQSTVNGTHGYILLPDDWNTPNGISFQGNPEDWTTNQYTIEEWAMMESVGAVFLPAAGYRCEATSVCELSDYGYYWSSTPYSETHASCIYFFNVSSRGLNFYRYYGRSVRLVQDYNK